MNANIPVLPSTEDSTATAPAPGAAKRLDATHVNIVLTIEGQENHIFAPYKVFSTGSKGFYASEKVVMQDETGRRYQCGFTITRIGSKHE